MSHQDDAMQDLCEESLVLFIRSKHDVNMDVGQYYDQELSAPKIFLKKVKKSVAQMDNICSNNTYTALGGFLEEKQMNSWKETFKKCLATAKEANHAHQEETVSHKNSWENVAESYEFDLSDIALAITNDVTNKDGVPFIYVDYFDEFGNEIYNSPVEYYTVKDCLRDNAIFVNSKRFLLEFAGEFKE